MGASSNNTNKLSPQEHNFDLSFTTFGSNNTNKLSPQERSSILFWSVSVQIIQINLVLKNDVLLNQSEMLSSNNTNKLSPQELNRCLNKEYSVQIIQINLVLKNCRPYYSIFMLYLQYILSISIIKC